VSIPAASNHIVGAANVVASTCSATVSGQQHEVLPRVTCTTAVHGQHMVF
jgi:hypothetical protein